ncbi:MAG: CotH kinase family protein [Fibromonadales bacterium]|nr:CotH kinase family protein [Fibromonadales bacterium]
MKQIIAVFFLSVLSFAQIPEIRVTTKDSQMPSYKTDNGCNSNSGGGWGWGMPSLTQIYAFDYVAITEFKLTDPKGNNLTRSAQPDSIRLRGNSTATVEKRPFRIKFDKKVSVFGKEAARSWVLLANHYDKTSTLNAMAFSLGQRLGLAYTPTFQFVELYINNIYRGIYLFTEQIQVNPGRVDIDNKAGWLAEFDFHSPASDECQNYFTTNRYNLTTFIKSPEDLPDSTGYRFVKNDLNSLVDSMYLNSFPENGYRNLIDLESFAKYVLIQQLMDNHDFNSHSQSGGLPGSNFAYKDVGQRIHAGPLWDFDLSTGEFNGVMTYTHFTKSNGQINPRHAFYQRLWADTVFLVKFKKTWDKYKTVFTTEMPTFIDSLTGAIKTSATKNYQGCGSGATCSNANVTALTITQYNAEIDKLKKWWTDRVKFFGDELNKWNIDMSKDIQQQPPTLIKNGLELQAKGDVRVDIYTIHGKLQKTVNFANGTYSIPLNDLPKGMYIVKVSFGSEKRILRVPVR